MATDTSTPFRLGFGELTTEKGVQGHARMIFLHVAGNHYPEMVADLKELSDQIKPRHGGLDLIEPGDWELLENWAQKWNLTYRGAVADWALEIAYKTLADWERSRRRSWVWFVSFGGAVPDKPRDLLGKLSTDGDFDPMSETLKQAKARLPRRCHFVLSEIVAYYQDGGLRESPKLREHRHFEWAVRNQIGGESYSALARERLPKSIRERELADDLRAKDLVYNATNTIKHEVTDLKRIIGLTSPPGRRTAR